MYIYIFRDLGLMNLGFKVKILLGLIYIFRVFDFRVSDLRV